MAKQHKVTYKGEEMLMIDAINNPKINVHGFAYNSVKRRMKRYNVSFEEAVSTPRMKNAPGSKTGKDYSGTIATSTIATSMIGVHPKIKEAMLMNNNAFLRACEEYGKPN